MLGRVGTQMVNPDTRPSPIDCGGFIVIAPVVESRNELIGRHSVSRVRVDRALEIPNPR